MPKVCPAGAQGCVPGCADLDGEPNWCAHADAMSEDASADIWECAFRPSDLEGMLRHHLNSGANAYNEVVIDTRSYDSNLPESVLAIFFLTDGESEWKAREVYGRFRKRYPNWQAPLVSLDITREHEAFVLAT